MEVSSIADFERDQASEFDSIMDSAVDQLVALNQPGQEPPALADLMYRFADLALINRASAFNFTLPSTCKSWPAPHFGRSTLHRLITKPDAINSKHSCVRKQDAMFKFHPRKPPKSKPSQPISSVAVPSRDPPLGLLSLPPEIRNAIWALLAVRKDTTEAQLRRIRPCKNVSAHRTTIIRRFPREPVLASVNKQLRREVLSIFYGTNTFIFEKNACSMFNDYSMLNPAIIDRWKPRQGLATYVTHIDLSFNALPRTFFLIQIVYQLRRLPSDIVNINVSFGSTTAQKRKKIVEAEPLCICQENDLIAPLNHQPMDRDQDLVGFAAQLIRMRNLAIFGGPTRKKNGVVCPDKETCERCSRSTFEILYSGM
jgi:hypothetical protein